MYNANLAGFTDVLGDEIANSQDSLPFSLSSEHCHVENHNVNVELNTARNEITKLSRPAKGTGQYGQFRSIEEIDEKYRDVFSYSFFNLVQSSVIDDALYSDKSMVVCAPTGSGKTVVFEMAIVQLLMEMEDKQCDDDFKIIYMAPVKALCTERLTEWYPKFTKLGLMCIEVTGDTNVDFTQLKPYRIIITTPEKWDMVTRRWREHRQLVEVIKLFLIDEVHILNDESRGPVLEAVVSRMKTIESSAQSAHRIEQLQNQYQGTETVSKQSAPKIRFIAVSATVSNPEDVAAWLGTSDKPAVYYKFGDESRPVKLKRVVEGYPCPEGTSIFKFDIILNYKLWPIIQKYHNGKATLIFCNTRKSVALTAETLSKELTISFNPEQKAKLTAIASTIKNKKLQSLVLSGVGCHHAGLLYEERINIERAFRNRDLPILITTTTLAMGVNLPAHLVIIKNTQQYVNGAYQEYSISTILQMVGRAGRPQFDTEATAVIMTRFVDKPRYQALVGGSEPLQSYLHKRLAENLNSEAALCTVNDVAQCVQWLRSTFLCVRAAKDPRRYLGLPQAAPKQLISKKLEELCVKAMNGLATSGLITMDDACFIESTEAGRLMSIFYLDVETMKLIMKINGTETLDKLLWVICESHELSDMHLRVDERRCLNTLNRNNAAATIRYPMKGKISTRQMKLSCIIQAILGCLPIPDPSLNQEAMKIMRIAERICKCLVTYLTRPALTSQQPKFYSAVLNSIILEKCINAHLWENSPYVSKQLRGIGPTFSTLLATAGKVNFMVLEESHPRDLERIMNKGPPAGNVLRKQVSLLPKYQLTMSPIDEKSVSIRLILLNQNYLSENMEHLTAGDNHKAYLVVGDSENNLLLLTPFKDKDLISIYDGTITHQITRKHSFEHKLFAQCISSSFVGIDAHCDYLFKDLDGVFAIPNLDAIDFVRPANKQTVITDTFKERKRKNNMDDVTQSKEKKKRDSTLIEKFNVLKESFGKRSKEMKEDLNKSAVMSNKIVKELTNSQILEGHQNYRTKILPDVDANNSDTVTSEVNIPSGVEWKDKIIIEDDDDFIDDTNIDTLLNDIENEISKRKDSVPSRMHRTAAKNTSQNVQSSSVEPCIPKFKNINKITMERYKPLTNSTKRLQKNTKSNYNFIEALEEKMDLSLEENSAHVNNTGFSDTIKDQIHKYLEHTKRNSKALDTITELLEINEPNNSEDIIRVPENENGKHNTVAILKQDVTLDIPKEKYAEIIDSINNTISAERCENKDTEHNDNPTTIFENIDTNYLNDPTETLFNMTDHITISSDIVENTIADQYSQNYKDDIIIEEERYLNNLSLVSYAATEGYQHDNLHQKRNENPCEEFKEQIEVHNTNKVATPLTYQSHVARIDPANTRSTFKENIFSYNGNYSKPATRQNTSEINNRNHNEKIRKYSYTNTKIDVASTSTDDSIIQVIRRIKMDLDITEIISERKKDHVQEEEVENQHEKCNVEKLDYESPFEQNTHLEENRNAFALMPCSERNTRKRDDIVNKEHYDKIRTNVKRLEIKLPKPLENRTCLEDTAQALVPFYRNNTRKHEIVKNKRSEDSLNDEGATKMIKPLALPAPIQSVQRKPTVACDMHASVHQIENTTHDISEENNNSKQDGNSLSNILQKYSKILRKSNNTALTPLQPKTLDKGLSEQTIKTKRPFKITNIQNVNAALPKTLISDTCKRESIPPVQNVIEIAVLNPIVPKIDTAVDEDNEENFHYESQPKKPRYLNESICSADEDYIEGEIEDANESLPELQFPTIALADKTVSEKEFNIDQILFNPKNLLQSIGKEVGEIVPPPPEFCDQSEISQDTLNSQLPTDCYEPMQWNNYFENVYSTQGSISVDDTQLNSTPSREIETWTLSQNDESCDSLPASLSMPKMFDTPVLPYPKMYDHSMQNSQFQGVSVTRKHKLGQFKFSDKKKLKWH